MSTNTDNGPTPTDLDLMLYADGELEGEERAAVEAWILRDEAARKKLVAMGMVAGVVREKAHATAARADDLADLVMAKVAAEPAPSSRKIGEIVAMPRRAANDNMRGIWAVAAIAVAAAAAMLFWAQRPEPKGPAGRATAPTAGLSAPVTRDGPHPGARPGAGGDEAPKGETDVDHGVEVAAVNFGALTGAVYYVPSGSAASSTTTVVWLVDDPSGGNE